MLRWLKNYWKAILLGAGVVAIGFGIGLILGKFLSKELFYDKEAFKPVLEEHKQAVEEFNLLVNEYIKAVEFAERGKGNPTALYEADAIAPRAEDQLRAASEELQVAIAKNDRKKLFIVRQLLKEARKLIQQAREKITEFMKSAE